jgi:hypothetical protein
MSYQSTLPFKSISTTSTNGNTADSLHRHTGSIRSASQLNGNENNTNKVDEDDDASGAPVGKRQRIISNQSNEEVSPLSSSSSLAYTVAASSASSAAAAAPPASATVASTPHVRSFHLLELYGDLFTCTPTTSLAHCVSVCLAMGKGVAVAFKEQFGGVNELKGAHPINHSLNDIDPFPFISND